MSKVTALPGCRDPNAGPNEALIKALRDILTRAEDGELQSFIGTGYTVDGGRLSVWCDFHENVYGMLGAISWLEHEYVERHTK